MSLKLTLDTLDSLPEVLHEYYEPSNTGGFVLKLDTPVVAKSRFDEVNSSINEFRSNNKVLSEELSKIKGEKKSNAPSQVDELVTTRIKEKAAEWEETTKKLTTELETYKSRFKNSQLESAIIDAASKNKVKTGALTDIQLRARGVFSVGDDGKIVALDSDGQPLFDKDATTPLSVNAWMANMSKEASHLFEVSTGSGATGNTGKTAPAAKINGLDVLNDFANGLKPKN